jgi:hypothetical protein
VSEMRLRLPLYVENLSDEEAKRILARRASKKKYYEKGRPLDPRPRCSEIYKFPDWTWQCSFRAITTMGGKPYCRIHAKMFLAKNCDGNPPP